jgi:hypothetical protein
MGRKTSPVKTALIASCEKEGLIARKSDSVVTLINRLSKYEKAPKQLQSPVKKNKKPDAIKTLYSTPTNPLPASYKAQAFVEDKFDGDLSQAGPEWKVGSKDKVKLMIPEWRNTKGGNRVRWVLFK